MREIDVFLDIDGCLINQRYEFTSSLDKLRLAAKQISDKARINLNSNRSLPSILKIWERVLFNGLLIYENGIGTYNPITKEGDSFGQSEFDRDSLLSILNGVAEGFDFISTDELVREPKKFVSDIASKIYFEETRKFTLTAYPRLFKNNIPFIDPEYITEVKKRFESAFSNSYNIRTSDSYGNIILVPKNAIKSNPMRRISRGSNIASFGDELADTCMFDESSYGLCGCPGNSPELVKDFVKRQEGFVSSEDYTNGVIGFLEYLNNYLGRSRNEKSNY